jgi:hypothetical protein
MAEAPENDKESSHSAHANDWFIDLSVSGIKTHNMFIYI